MILKFFAKTKPDTVPQQIYGTVVAQSRLAAFYTEYGFADNVTGRFDVLALHMFLLSHKLSRDASPLAPALSQEVFNAFTESLDDALRALGIGDTSVPKRKKALVRGFYAQVGEFAPLLDGDLVEALAQAAGRRFFAGGNPEGSLRLAQYMVSASRLLAAQSFEAICAGKLRWPDPVRD